MGRDVVDAVTRKNEGRKHPFAVKVAKVLNSWAVSSPKRNKLMMMLKEVKSVWHKQFGRAPEVEALARPGIELPGNGVEFGLREARKIGALGEILAEQAVSILVDAALPGAVRIGEIDRDARDLGKLLVLRHFAPLIVSHRQALLRINAIEDGAKGGHRCVSGGIFHLGQRHEERGPFDQSADGRRIAGALDQIALPVTWNDALIDLRRAQMDAGHIGDRAPAIVASGARPATLARLTKTCNQLGAQRSAWHSVERGVDGFVADLKARLIRVHPLQYACDLFGRMTFPKKSFDMPPQRPIHSQARRASCRARQSIGSLLRKRCAIAARHHRPPTLLGRHGWIAPTIAFQLTADRTRRAMQTAGNCPQSASLLKTQLNHRSLFTTQVFVVRSHRNTLPPGKVPGAKEIKDVKAFYEAQVPAGRGCRVIDVMRAIFYVMEQEYETGQAVPVTGGQNMLN